MAAAVITPNSGSVINCIVADADRDYAPSVGQVLVNIPDGVAVTAGFTWTSSGGFTPPPPPPAPSTASDPVVAEPSTASDPTAASS